VYGGKGTDFRERGARGGGTVREDYISEETPKNRTPHPPNALGLHDSPNEIEGKSVQPVGERKKREETKAATTED